MAGDANRPLFLGRSGLIWKAALLALILFLLGHTTIRTEYGYFCENSGSLHGYTKWPFGATTSKWYHESELERFLTAEGVSFDHRWTSFKGTGRSLFGWTTYRGHGNPGPFFSAPKETFDSYIRNLTPDEKLEIHAMMIQRDEKGMEDRLTAIWRSPTK